MKRAKERGFLLIAVLVIVMLASMVALSLIFRLRAEEASFAAGAGSEQAWHAALSGVQQAMHLARSGTNDVTIWQNNPGAFFHQLVTDEGTDKWYFTVYTVGVPGEKEPRYGLSDESAKINLNKASAAMLFRAFDFPTALVQQITGEQTEATNSPLSEAKLPELTIRPQFNTLDDLLLVNGIPPGMIYGEDANHNFALEPNEDDGDSSFPPDDGDGQLFLGLQDLITVFTYEFDITHEKLPRVQLNSTSTNWNVAGLPETTVAFIAAAKAAQKRFDSPADLLLAKEKFKNAEGKEIEMESGVTAENLAPVMDKFTAVFEARIKGLININTAPVSVLKGLPGIDEAKAEAIVSERESLRVELRQNVAWLFTENVLTADEFKKVAPFITTRSLQFRFNVVGYGMPSGRYRVYEVVIDIADRQPQVLYLRDITRFGLPFALPVETEGKAPRISS
jgi:DNA uptake protein ComE-like DNA-binding protein